MPCASGWLFMLPAPSIERIVIVSGMLSTVTKQEEQVDFRYCTVLYFQTIIRVQFRLTHIHESFLLLRLLGVSLQI